MNIYAVFLLFITLPFILNVAAQFGFPNDEFAEERCPSCSPYIQREVKFCYCNRGGPFSLRYIKEPVPLGAPLGQEKGYCCAIPNLPYL